MKRYKKQNTHWCCLLLGLCACLGTGTALQAEVGHQEGAHTAKSLKPFRVYTTGNSLTAQTMFGSGWEKLADWMRVNRGIALEVARDHTGGTSLDYRFMQFAARRVIKGEADHYRCDAFVLQTYATYNGLGTYARSDLLAAQRYLDLLASQSPTTPLYIYVLYPRVQEFKDFGEGWNHSFDFKDQSRDNWLRSSMSKTYFEGLHADLTAYAREQGYSNPIRMIPVGHVMARLHQMMKAGEIAGFTDVRQLHSDAVHHNALGGWMDTLTFYAVIFGEDPAPLPFDLVERKKLEEMIGKDPRINEMARIEAAEKLIKQVVWETVTAMEQVTGCRREPF